MTQKQQKIYDTLSKKENKLISKYEKEIDNLSGRIDNYNLLIKKKIIEAESMSDYAGNVMTLKKDRERLLGKRECLNQVIKNLFGFE